MTGSWKRWKGMREAAAARRSGFSLIELMVALAVTGILTVMLANVMLRCVTLLRQSRNSLDAYSQMRLVLDRIQNDVRRGLWRSDTNPYFKPELAMKTSTGNDSFMLLSNVIGFQGDRTLSVVGYKVAAPVMDGAKLKTELLRGVSGSSWLSTNGFLITFGYGTTDFSTRTAISTASGGYSIPEDSYDAMSDQIVRMEICFIEKSTGAIRKDPLPLDNLKGFVVTLAAVEGEALQHQSSTGNITSLVSLLSDASDGTTTPILSWQQKIDAASSSPLQPVLQRTRLLERQFYVRP